MLGKLVSVVIPAHNGAPYLVQAIRSVLAQDYSNYDIWVIDNGSSDLTAQVAQSFPEVNYLYMGEANVALARNQGIVVSKGEYVAFLDQDDIWLPNKLKAQVQFLEANQNHDAVIGLQSLYLQPGHTKPHWLKQTFLDKAQPGYLPSTLLVRRRAFARMGLFDTQFPLASDVAWFFKVKQSGLLLGTIPEVLIKRRIHNANASNDCADLQRDILKVIQSSLAQRRQG